MILQINLNRRLEIVRTKTTCEQIGTLDGTRCVKYMQLRSGKMVTPRPNPNEESSSGESTVVLQITDVGSCIVSAVSTAHSGPILIPRQHEISRPTMMGTSGKYMPSFTMPMYQTLGMPTEFVASIHNSSSTFGNSSTFGENPSSPFPSYHGLGNLENQFSQPPGLGFSSQSIPTFTSSSVAVIRQQMDEVITKWSI